MPSALKIKSASSRFFDQEQVSLPPLGKDMVTIQPIPSHKEAMTFSYAARSGTEVYSPTPSFCLHSLSPTPFQFTLCLCLPPSPQSAPREESCSWRVSIRLSRSLGSVTFVTWLITLGIKKKIDPISVFCLFFSN